MILKKTYIQTGGALSIQTKEGFEKVYRLYVKKLCRIAYNQIQDECIVEGIVQNVFISLWERRASLSIKGPIENYLVRAVKLAALDHIRTQINHRKHLELSLANHCGKENCTEEKLNFNELTEQVNHLVDQLPCQCREVYRLSREKGKTISQIASTLLIAEKTVEAHLTKALKFLRLHLVEYQRV
ncbi:RNA polymerase sigma-70 factor [Fulvivirgaceae bacterium BMA12]|uniref:RNA polymerase sigma-70 factor n=1 Tax=Agaribacillus aureus TaxID=3051825 RepID=A0ABT8LHL2_9BACT|nr:RNA polymerase sigma-70 factor [Fulvivirgaceae bacterium BMA12]